MKKTIITTVLTCIALCSPAFAVPFKPAQANKMKVAAKHVAKHAPKHAAKKKAKQGGFSSSSSSSSCSSSSSEHPSQLTYISAAAYQSPSSSQIVNIGAPVLFNSILDTKGSVVYNSLTRQFTVFDAGSYAISFGAVFTSTNIEGGPTVIALRVNGTEVAGSQLASEGDADMISMSLIQTFTGPSTTIEVIASGLNTNPITLVDPLSTTTSAFITITRLP